MVFPSTQLRESLAAGAVWGAYRGMKGFSRASAKNPTDNPPDANDLGIFSYNPLRVQGDMYTGAIEGANAFARVAVGLYAYHLLAGHVNQPLTHEQMKALMR